MREPASVGGRGLVRGQPPLPTERHPGIPGYAPTVQVPHAGIPLSMRPSAQGGIVRRRWSRAGVHSATPEPVPPPVFAYLLARVRQMPQGPVGARVLIARTQAAIGVVH